MTAPLLKSLMHLFSIVANLDTYDERARRIVQRFLEVRLKQEDGERYLTQFDEEMQNISKWNESKGENQDGISLADGQKITETCAQINGELTQQEKIALLISLFALINANDEINADEDSLLLSIANIFKINPDEFQAIRDLSLEHIPKPDRQKYFITYNTIDNGWGKVIQVPDMVGSIRILKIQSIGAYIVKYKGTAKYSLDSSLLESGQLFTFPTGAILRGSKIKPIYYSEVVSHFSDDALGNKISFEVRDVAFDFPNGRRGLHTLTIAEESGSLVGIMGPSGAGKSTLLEILNGNAKPTEGTFKINGLNYHENKDSLQNLIGFVPQDDLLIEDLTVAENLYFAAKLSFGSATEEELNALVHQTLLSLGITDIANLKVGSPLQKIISGGERKRVNIALELLRKPGVLFLDEPTSGLSSRNSLSIMDLLKQLTLQQKLIFVVIHQPSSDIFKMFDKLIILDKGGYMIYYGNPVEAISYFKEAINHIKSDETVCIECGNVNPEQVFDIIETKTINEYGHFTHDRKVSTAEWKEAFDERLGKPEPLVHAAPFVVDGKKASWWQQLVVFIRRDWKTKFRNTQYLAINGLQTPFLALILAYANRYYDTNSVNPHYSFAENVNIPVYFFMSIIIAIFTGLTISAEEIFADRKILKREKFLKLSYSSYLSSKIVTLFLLSGIQMLALVLIGNSILEIDSMTWQYWLVLFSSSCFANLIGLNLSATFNSAVTIYILIPLALIPQLILGGVVISYDKMNPALQGGARVPVFGELMASRWGYEALMVEQFKNNPYNTVFYESDRLISFCNYQTSTLLPDLQERLETCKEEIRTNKKGVDIVEQLLVIKRSFRHHEDFTKIKFAEIDNLNPKAFSEASCANALVYLKKITEFYDKKYADACELKRVLKEKYLKQPNGIEKFQYNRATYDNSTIANIVQNKNAEVCIILEDGELIERTDPIYNYPKPLFGLDFRTHFFAPVKYFAGEFYDTLLFNIAIIWSMTGALYIALYFKLFKNFLKLFGSRKAR